MAALVAGYARSFLKEIIVRNIHTLLVALLLAIAVPSYVFAEAPFTDKHYPDSAILTLPAALQKTLRQNPQLHQFEFIRKRLRAERDTNALNPSYALGLTVENVAGTGDISGFDGAEITLALSSVIELGYKREARVTVAEARLERLEQEKRAQTLDVLGQVTSAFIQLLTTQEELKLAADAVRLSESLYKTVQERARRGAASDAEVRRAKASLAQSRLQDQFVRQKYERQKVSLARFWGDTTLSFSFVEGNLYGFGEARDFAELYARVQQAPAIEIFASELRLKEAELRLAKTQNKADLSWQMGIRQLQANGDTALTLGVSVPLFTERRNESRIVAAMAEYDVIASQRAERLLALHDRLFDAYSQRQQYVAAYEQLIQNIIPDLEIALSITRDAFEQGRLKYLDWIAAQQELLAAKQQRIQTASVALLNQALIEQLTAEPLTISDDAGTKTNR